MSSQSPIVEYPVQNTYIQFPVARDASLEEFCQPRAAFSCPVSIAGSRMVSLEEDPRESLNDSVIQWPATRGPSLDDEEEAAKFAFEVTAALQSAWNQTQASTEASTPEVVAAPEAPPLGPPPPRWASVEDDDDLPDFMSNMIVKKEEVVAPAFQWPATRGPSLDEFEGAPMFSNFQSAAAPTVAPAEGVSMLRNLQSCSGRCFDAPAAPVAPAEAAPMFCNLESLLAPPAAPAEGASMFCNLQSPAPLPVVPEMFMQGVAIDELMQAKCSSNHRESYASDASTTVSADEDHTLTTPPSGLSDDEAEAEGPQDTSATLKISLTDTLGLWSIGSAAHESGTCKPCAFLWKDLSKPGCHHGPNCVFCHLCPPGEVKRRKKEKMFMRKLEKNLMNNPQLAMGVQPQFELQYQDQAVAGYGMW